MTGLCLINGKQDHVIQKNRATTPQLHAPGLILDLRDNCGGNAALDD